MLRYVALIVMLIYPTASFAQQQGSAAAREKAEQALVTLPNVSEVVRPGFYLTLDAGSDAKNGTATVSIESASGAFSTSLSVAGPLDEGTKEAVPLTLKGLANSANVSLGLHWFHWANKTDTFAMKRMCQAALGKNECDDSEFSDQNQRAEFNKLAHADESPIIVTVKGAYGRSAFKFLDQATLTSGSQAHNAGSIEVGIGRYNPSVGYVGISYAYERKFEPAGAATQICQPIGAAAALQCKSAIIGAPNEKTLDVAAAEWRLFFPGGKLAVNPSVAYDFKDAVTAIDVPVYFLSTSNGGLAGGARVGWRSDKSGMSVSVFVATALGITP